MKAVLCRRFGDVAGLTYEECSRPAMLANQVRVEVHAASLGFADVLMAQGLYQVKPQLPYSPGACGAGVVVEVGADVRGVAPGDRVSFLNYYGAFAEEMVTYDHTLVKLPPTMSFEQAATYRLTYSPAYFALKLRAALQPGETLVVTGATGGIGMAAVKLGKAFGARVIAAVGGAAKVAAAYAAGADHVINYASSVFKDEVKALTDGLGADVIFEVVGGDLQEQAIRAIRPFGRLLILGFAGGRIPSIPMNLPLLKNCSIVGVNFGGWAIHKNFDAVAGMNAELLKLTMAGKLDNAIADRFPLERTSEAMQALLRHEKPGKIVISVR